MNLFDCFQCRQPTTRQAWLCRDCVLDLTGRLHPRQTPVEWLEGIPLVSFGAYEGVFSKLLKRAKGQPSGFIGGELEEFFRALVRHWGAELKLFGSDFICHVPSHPVRSFFQTDLSRVLATEIAREIKIPVTPGLLGFELKSVWGGHSQQKLLKREARVDIARRGRFKISKALMRTQGVNGRVLLVDDICATGASLGACKRLLENAGLTVAAHVVLARSEKLIKNPRP